MTNTGKATTCIFSRKIRVKPRLIAKKNAIMGKRKAMSRKCPSSQRYSKEVKFMVNSRSQINVNSVYSLPVADIIPNCSVDDYGWIVQQLVSGQAKI